MSSHSSLIFSHSIDFVIARISNLGRYIRRSISCNPKVGWEKTRERTINSKCWCFWSRGDQIHRVMVFVWWWLTLDNSLKMLRKRDESLLMLGIIKHQNMWISGNLMNDSIYQSINPSNHGGMDGKIETTTANFWLRYHFIVTRDVPDRYWITSILRYTLARRYY